MKLMIKLQFSSDGAKPLDVVERLQAAGFMPEVGKFDFSFHFETPDQYGELTEKLHKALEGTKTRYQLYSVDRDDM